MSIEYPIEISILITTYNHEKYIEESIESVLSQNIQCKYEIVITDDASSDKTPEIVQNFYNKYPDIFKPVYHSINIGSTPTVIETLERCKGKYIALLAGDDFFSDNNKLQIQYETLEADNEISLCYTNAFTFYNGDYSNRFISLKNHNYSHTFDLDYYVQKNGFYIPPITEMIRKSSIPPKFPEWIYNSFHFDWALNFFILQNGKAQYLDIITASYRIHKKSMSRTTNFVNITMNGIELAKNLDKYFNFKYHILFNLQWRYQELTIFYFQKKNYFKALKALLKSFLYNPILIIKDIQFHKRIYNVLFKGLIIYD